MKNLKKIVALVLCLLMATVMLTGCKKSIVGEWELDSVDSSSGNSDLMLSVAMIKSMGASMDFEFTEDEMITRATVFGISNSETMKYELDGDKIVFEDGTELTYKLSGKKLTLSDGVDTLILKRK